MCRRSQNIGRVARRRSGVVKPPVWPESAPITAVTGQNREPRRSTPRVSSSPVVLGNAVSERMVRMPWEPVSARQQAARRIERPSYWKISVTWAGVARALRLFERSALGRRHHQMAETRTVRRMRRAYGLNESPSEQRRIALQHPGPRTPVDVLGEIAVFLSEKRVV